jgi:hypothetical protein
MFLQSTYRGIPSYKYSTFYNIFSTSVKADNYYCELNSKNESHVDGVLDVSDCIYGSPPVFVSYAHFMEGDEKLFEHIDGLKPNREIHSPYMHLHPRLSVPMYGISKMQLNLRVTRFRRYYEKIPENIILPLAWVETAIEDLPLRFKVILHVIEYVDLFFKYASIISLLISTFNLIKKPKIKVFNEL